MLIDGILLLALAHFFIGLGRVFYRIIQRCGISEINAGIAMCGFYGLFLFAVLGVTANFFVGLAVPFFLGSMGLLSIVGTVDLIIAERRYYLLFLPLLVLITFLGGFASVLTPVGVDGGGYHFPHQVWIRSEKIVIGLAHLQSRYGFNNLNDFIQAPFWLGNDAKGVLLSFWLFPCFTLLLCFETVIASRNAVIGRLSLFLFAALSLMMLENKFITLYFSKPDIPAAFTFFWAFVFGVDALFFKQRESFFSSVFFAVFSVMIKLSSLTAVLWILYTVAAVGVSEREMLLKYLRVCLVLAVFGLPWLIRGVLTSGCVLYPIAASCFEPSWGVASSVAVGDVQSVTLYARSPENRLLSTDWGKWFPLWLQEYYTYHLEVIRAPLYGVLAALVFFRLRKGFQVPGVSTVSNRYPKHPALFTPGLGGFSNYRNILVLLIILLAALVLWFISSPAYRFGLGVFLSITFLIPWAVSLSRHDITPKPKWQKWLFGLSILVCIGFFFGILPVDKIIPELRNRPLLSYSPTSITTKNRVYPDKNFGVITKNKDICWLIPHCSPFERPPAVTRGGYRVFLRP